MNGYYVFALLLALISFVRPASIAAGRAEDRSSELGGSASEMFVSEPVEENPRAQRYGVLAFSALCVALCAAFAWQTALRDVAIRTQTPMPDWFAKLPLQFFYADAPLHLRADETLLDLIRLLALVECALLFALAAVLHRFDYRRGPYRFIAAAGALALSAIAFRATTASVDLYAYVGYALVWPAQYHPAAVAFAGDGAVINRLWGLPLLPSVYGPLWSALAALAVGFAHSLGAQLLAVRVLMFFAIAASVAALFAFAPLQRTAFLFALDPAVYDLYLTQAHNDILALPLLLAAALARRLTWLAIALVAAAVAIKLPFLLFGVLVFWNRPTLRARLVPAAAAAALGIIASLAMGGPQYVDALYAIYQRDQQPLSGALAVFKLLLVGITLFAVAAALVRQRFWAGVPWSFLSVSEFQLPWYLAWCLPYVLWSERTALPFLILWPAAVALLTPELLLTPNFLTARVLLGLAATFALGLAIRARLSQRPLRAAG